MRLIAYVALVLVSCSCTSIYVPTVRNVPLFSGKGEFQSTFSGGIGLNLQAAYSPANHLALAGSLLYADNRYMNVYDYRVHRAFDVALGYYISGKLSFEVFGGYGKGKGHGRNMSFGLFIFPSVPQTAEGQYEKYFFQPTIGKKFGKFEMALTSRFTVVDYYTAHLTSNHSALTTQTDPVLFIEPCVTVKFFPIRNRRLFFAFVQPGVNRLLNDEQEVSFRYTLVHFNAGLGLKLQNK